MLETKNRENFLKNAETLAFLGDAVFTLEVRKCLVETHNSKPNSLNKLANSVVCARFQAEIMKQILGSLTEQETDLVMRARNSHLSGHKAKNSTLEEYSLATQLEALMGVWFLNGENEKIKKVITNYCLEKLC